MKTIYLSSVLYQVICGSVFIFLTVGTLELISAGHGELVLGDTAYYLKVYTAINTFRSKHVSPSLKWNKTLNDYAETLAIQLVQDLSEPDPEDFEGVNSFSSKGGRPSSSFVVGKWYNETSYYDYKKPGFGIKYINFTQLVWKSSKTVGIGAATFNNYSVVVAKFFPRGNLDGTFRFNVIPARL